MNPSETHLHSFYQKVEKIPALALQNVPSFPLINRKEPLNYELISPTTRPISINSSRSYKRQRPKTSIIHIQKVLAHENAQSMPHFKRNQGEKRKTEKISVFIQGPAYDDSREEFKLI